MKSLTEDCKITATWNELIIIFSYDNASDDIVFYSVAVLTVNGGIPRKGLKALKNCS